MVSDKVHRLLAHGRWFSPNMSFTMSHVLKGVKTYATDLKELFADVNQSDQESYEVYLADNSKAVISNV